MSDFLPEGCLIEEDTNSMYMQSITNLTEAYREQRILEARATVCDSNHNLTVDLGCIKGIIPRKEGAIGIKEAQGKGYCRYFEGQSTCKLCNNRL